MLSGRSENKKGIRPLSEGANASLPMLIRLKSEVETQTEAELVGVVAHTDLNLAAAETLVGFMIACADKTVAHIRRDDVCQIIRAAKAEIVGESRSAIVEAVTVTGTWLKNFGFIFAVDDGKTEAAANVHTALVTYAARDSSFDGQEIRAGEYLVLLENTMLTHGSDFDAAASAIADALAAFGPELITVYTGQDAKEEQDELLCAALSSAAPEAEVSVIPGGQPVYYYMIAAE